MSKSTRHGRQGARGVPGPPGPRGKQGGTGATGTTGKTGKTGKTGLHGLRGERGKTGPSGKLLPAGRREVFGLVQAQIAEVSRELAAQIKRLGLLSNELDAMRANVASLFKATA